MLYTEPQNQFKTELDKDLHGIPWNVDPIYEGPYKMWTGENEYALAGMNTERRTVLFSDFVEDQMIEQEKKLIDLKEENLEKRQILYSQALRGDLLLASTDSGQHFTEVLTVAEAQERDLSTLRLFSSSLRSAALNLVEVKEEQNMQHITRKLREQGCAVITASIEDHVVHVELIHPKSGTFTVNVELNQDPQIVPIYTIENQKERKEVPENQLFLVFGAPAQEPTLLSFKEDMQDAEVLNKNELARKAVLNTVLPLQLLKNRQEQFNTRQAATALMAYNLAHKQLQAPALYNVAATKTAVAAHKARSEKKIAGEKERWEERQKKYQAATQAAYKKSLNEKKAQETRKQENQRSQEKVAMIAAGGGAGLLAGAATVTAIVTHITALHLTS